MMRAPLLLAGATAAAADYSVLVFGDSWGDIGPGAATIKTAFKTHNVAATVKNAAIGGTTACGWAKNADAMVTAAKSKFPDLPDGPDFVWYTAGGNDLINDNKFHSCTKNAKSIDAARGCYDAATDIPNKCSSTMFDVYWKAFPKSKVMQCNYDIPCETGSCATGLDQGYLGNYCGTNITCMNTMALKFQDSMVGRLRQKYAAPQYTGLLIGGTVQMAAGVPGAKVGTPVLDASGPCNMMIACVHPESFSKAGKAIGEAFWDLFFSKYV